MRGAPCGPARSLGGGGRAGNTPDSRLLCHRRDRRLREEPSQRHPSKHARDPGARVVGGGPAPRRRCLAEWAWPAGAPRVRAEDLALPAPPPLYSAGRPHG